MSVKKSNKPQSRKLEEMALEIFDTLVNECDAEIALTFCEFIEKMISLGDRRMFSTREVALRNIADELRYWKKS